MKKYEYKYVKTEASFGMNTQKAIDADEVMLVGFGLEGWRVHSVIQSYYLMEREFSDKPENS